MSKRHKPRVGSSSNGFFCKKALVSGFARSFVSQQPIVDATITIIANQEFQFQTDSEGKFGPFLWPVGKQLTLKLEKKGNWWTGYHTTQTATIIVPPEGINDANYLKNISFQVPSNIAYRFFSWVMGVTADPSTCQIAATITPPGVTMADCPQGEAGVEVSLSPNPHVKPRYPGMLPWIHKTNFFNCEKATVTSRDGGVIFANVPEGIYTLNAKKKGRLFSQVKLIALRGGFINASPPNGPTMR